MTSVLPFLWRGAAVFAVAAAGFWLVSGMMTMTSGPAPGVAAPRLAAEGRPVVVAGAEANAEEEPEPVVVAAPAFLGTAGDFAPATQFSAPVVAVRGLAEMAPRPAAGGTMVVASGKSGRRASTPDGVAPASRSTVRSGALAVSAAESAPIVAPAGNVAIPVAFQPLPSDDEWTEVQRKQSTAVQEQFVRDIGGPDQDPASPEYAGRWRQAQWTADQQFRAMFGVQAFLQRQMARARADAAAGGESDPP